MRWMLLMVVAFFIGCDEYISKVPVTERPNSEIPAKYLGRWVFIGEWNDSYTVDKYPIAKIELLKWGNKEYLLLGEDVIFKKVMPYKLWNSRIQGIDYLNIEPINVVFKDSNYFILKYRMIGDLLQIYPLRTRDILNNKFDIKRKLKKYIKRNRTEINNFFPKDWITFYRWENLNWKFINEIRVSNIISIKNDGKLVDKDSMLNEFDKYHLIESKPWKQGFELSTSYLIESMDGDTFKILKTNNTLYDIRDDKWYAKTQDN